MTLPMHERIRSEMEAAILSGELHPGARLPTEQELMHDYGCARMTVNKALSALASAGLIERRKRAGSFVARPKVHAMVLDVPDLAAEVRARGQAHRFQVLRSEVADKFESLPGGLDLSGDHKSPVLHVVGTHHADAQPFAYEDRLIGLAAIPDIIDVDFSVTAPGTWLLQHVPWTEAETRISARPAGDVEAKALRIDRGSACLCIERRTWQGQKAVTVVRQLFVATSYELVAKFGRLTHGR